MYRGETRWSASPNPYSSRRIPPMLVLNRKVGERILIGDNIVVTVVRVQGRQVRIGIEAPGEVAIRRQELLPQDTADDSPSSNRRLVPVEVG
jgi:carbon storage regulator